MSDQRDTQIQFGFIGFVVGIIVTVTMLHLNGYLRHSTPGDADVVDQLTMLSIRPGLEQRISSKDSGKEAFCSEGYLLIRPNTEDKRTAAIVVDARNRPIDCAAELLAPKVAPIQP